MKRDRASVMGRTMTWLLAGSLKLENNYWCTSNQKCQGRIRNQKIEDLVWNCIHRARVIKDSDVNTFEFEDQLIA